MTCELVTAVTLATTTARPITRVRRLCLAALIRQAAREGAIVVDFKHKRVIMPPEARSKPIEVLQVARG